jgi:hypothetical protein
LLQISDHPLFSEYVHLVFSLLKRDSASKKINVLEFLAGMAVCSESVVTLEEKIACLFDIFDLDNTGQLTKEELHILFMVTIHALMRFTKGLSGILDSVVTEHVVSELVGSCLDCARLGFRNPPSADGADSNSTSEVGVTKHSLLSWVKTTPPVLALIRHFVLNDSLNPRTLMKRHPRQTEAYASSRKEQAYFGSILSKMLEVKEISAVTRIQAGFRRNRAQRQAGALATKHEHQVKKDESVGAVVVQQWFRRRRLRCALQVTNALVPAKL